MIKNKNRYNNLYRFLIELIKRFSNEQNIKEIDINFPLKIYVKEDLKETVIEHMLKAGMSKNLAELIEKETSGKGDRINYEVYTWVPFEHPLTNEKMYLGVWLDPIKIDKGDVITWLRVITMNQEDYEIYKLYYEFCKKIEKDLNLEVKFCEMKIVNTIREAFEAAEQKAIEKAKKLNIKFEPPIKKVSIVNDYNGKWYKFNREELIGLIPELAREFLRKYPNERLYVSMSLDPLVKIRGLIDREYFSVSRSIPSEHRKLILETIDRYNKQLEQRKPISIKIAKKLIPLCILLSLALYIYYHHPHLYNSILQRLLTLIPFT